MRVNAKTVVIELRDALLLILISAVLVLSGVVCSNCNDNTRLILIMISLTALMWILLWKGNELLAGYLSKKISWLEFPLKRFLAGFIATVVYTLFVVYFLGTLYEQFFTVYLSSTVVTSVVIAITISLFMHGKSFLLNWKKASIEAERFERESIMARYESLRNQVSPHFLFNSLNALTHLVYQDKDRAGQFIRQLSMVYRYVLETREREVVSLKEEIDFVRAYLFLQEIRFGKKLRIDITPDDDMEGYIPPLAIQMLIENAIKHNVVSEEDPLTVKISNTETHIIVENNLQLKARKEEHSSGVGLENIRRRYELLSKENVVVESSGNCFRVVIPLLGKDVLSGKKTQVKPVINGCTVN